MDCPPQSVTRARLEGGACDGVEFLLSPGRRRLDVMPFTLRPDEDPAPSRLAYAFASRVDREGRAIFVPVDGQAATGS